MLRGLVVFYPGCERAVKNGAWNFAAPLLILSGESDDWDAMGPCRELAAHAGPAGTSTSRPAARPPSRPSCARRRAPMSSRAEMLHILAAALIPQSSSPVYGVEPRSGSTRDPRPQGRGRVRDGSNIGQSLTLPIPSGWAPSLSRTRAREICVRQRRWNAGLRFSVKVSLLRSLAVLALALGAALPAAAEPVEIPAPGGVVLKAELFRPAGPAVAPAIVALHGCGGAYPKRDRQWTAALTEAGHIMLFPDSFASHGLGPQCRVRDRIANYRELRRQDALIAAAWLAAEKDTPVGGVLLMGWSDGGSTVLAAGITAADLPAGLLRGLIAFYPACERAMKDGAWNIAAPLLILSGERDDWDPVAPCRELAAHAGSALELVSYPGAYHDFDVDEPVHVLKNVAFSQNADNSVHVGGDPAARADALQRVPAFIAALPPAAP